MDISKRVIMRYVIFIVVLCALELVAVVYLNHWRGVFWQAVEQKQSVEFLKLVGIFSVVAFIAVYTNAASNYFEQKLSTIWRIKLTDVYMPHYKKAMNLVDNIDQRMSEDIRHYTIRAVPWITGIIFNAVKFICFLTILFTLSTIVFGSIYILPLGTVVYTVIGLAITILIGHKLVGLNFLRQKKEADYRYGLAQVRTGVDDSNHGTRFTDVVNINLKVFLKNKYLNIWIMGFGQASVIIPILFLAPAYFVSAAMTFGILMQAINAVGEAQGSLSYLVNQWSEIVDWLACRKRLAVFKTALKGQDLASTKLM